MPNALLVDSVSKTFALSKGKDLLAVDDLSLKIPEGLIYGLLGPNGAGKSTLINMISGILRPSSGHISVYGIDVEKFPLKAKRRLGVVPQEIAVESIFTVKEVLHYFAGMNGVPGSERKGRIAEIIEQLDLADKADERAYNLSGGMKRRLMIAKAIVHKPRFLILDEPTAGVDVKLRKKIWDLVREMNRQGTTILFTTHYLEEAEQLCDELTIINHGKIVVDGSLKDIQSRFETGIIYFELFENGVQHLGGVTEIGIEYQLCAQDLPAGLKKLGEHYGRNLKSVRSESPSLEKIFLELTSDKQPSEKEVQPC